MSTNYSPKVTFYGDHNHQGPCVGQLVWHNTSCTVSWQVDGEIVATFGNQELVALQLAASCESGAPNVDLSDEERDRVCAALPSIGGWVKR